MNTTPLIHIVRLARRLNQKAEAENASSFMALLDDFKTLTETGYKCLLTAGVLSVMGYLLVSVQFYPSGVTLGDGFFFLMVAFVFGLSYALLILWGFLITHAARYVYRWAKKKKAGVGILAGLACVVFIALVVVYRDSATLPTFLEALVGFCVSGYCLLTLVESLDKPAAKQSARWIGVMLWIGMLFTPLVMSATALQNLNENLVMPKVGLRIEDVTLKLSEENYDILTSAANGQSLAVLGCSTSASGQPERLVHGVNLLWHGIGERSLVELPSSGEKNLIIELKREGVFALRNYAGGIERCLELSSDLVFEKGSSELSSDLEHLTDLLTAIASAKKRIEKIHVIGHSDALGYARGATENNQLALDRARTIKDKIVAQSGIAEAAVKAEGHGAREPKTSCKDWPVKATLSECLALNRRVEVRIKFLPPPNKDEAKKEPAPGTPNTVPVVAAKDK